MESNISENMIRKLICPTCLANNLELIITIAGESFLRCAKCKLDFPIIDGVVHFTLNRGSSSGINYNTTNWKEDEKAREHYYERKFNFSDEWLLSLPFPSQIETETTFQKKGGALGRNYFLMREQAGIKGSMCILDMAAGTCWTSREFAKMGCEVSSTDLRTIKYYGLRSADAYFAAGEPRFNRFCLAIGKLPFQNSVFDVVHCQNAFQYVENLNDMFAEIVRVLKPKGVVLLPWTGIKSPLKKKRWGPGYRLSEYISAAKFAGIELCVYPIWSLFDVPSTISQRGFFWALIGSFVSMFNSEKIANFPFASKLSIIIGSGLFGAPVNMMGRKLEHSGQN